MRPFVLLSILAVAACGSATVVETDPSRHQVNGPLSLELTDAPAQSGLFYALPSVTGSTGAVVVQSTRYGSLCQYAVVGDAEIAGNRLTLHVHFYERLTSCVAEVRALTYRATVSAVAGNYDVMVIHHEPDTRVDTLVRVGATVR